MTPPEPGSWVDWMDMPYTPIDCLCWTHKSDDLDRYGRNLPLPYATWRYLGPDHAGCPVHKQAPA